jgi:hypothetical protein
MQFSRRRMLIIASLMVLLSLGMLAVLSPRARLSGQVVALKLQGSLQEMSLSDVWQAVRPGSPYGLQTLIRTKNPYRQAGSSEMYGKVSEVPQREQCRKHRGGNV